MRSTQGTSVERDRRRLADARASGRLSTLRVFASVSGPGWLQSAVTLGGGSLAGALYLGVLGGYTLLWLQLVAITAGMIMLSTIAYVALSSSEPPFQAINRHINPALGWGWAIATLVANMVWCLPQFSLTTAAVQQNLLPGVLGQDSSLGDMGGKIVICAILLIISISVVWTYNREGHGRRIFDTALKTMVAVVVLCFFGVVVKLAATGNGLPWAEIASGFVPNLRQWSSPAEGLVPLIEAIPPEFRAFWTDRIVDMQQDVMIGAAASAVGINMTFLLPYSMLARGWDRDFRGAAVFDLFTGMVIPFLLVTSCVVIASANQFHTQAEPSLLEQSGPGEADRPPAALLAAYDGFIASRLQHELGPTTFTNLDDDDRRALAAALPAAERRLAATLVARDASHLSASLSPLIGNSTANVAFGIGVVGMGLSSIIALMLISGFVVSEVGGFPHGGTAYRWACLLPAVGVLGPFVWSGRTQFWIAVPTAIFGMMLLPIAYFTFLLMLNSERVLGSDRPSGARRVVWNLLAGASTIAASTAAGAMIWKNGRWYGVAAVAVFAAIVAVAELSKKSRRSSV